MFAPARVAAIMGALMLPVSVSAEQIVIKVGYGPGGSYDEAARLVADHLGRHLAGNPSFVVENVPGAGSLKLARLMMESTLDDGTEIATISSALALLPVFDPSNTSFDPHKVSYLASMTNTASYCISPKASGIDTLDAFLTAEFIVGATGPDSTTYTYPQAIKNALQANYKVITGFASAAEIDLAMERGDLQARCGIGITTLFTGDMLDRYNVIAELSVTQKREIDGVPFLLDRVTDPAVHEALSLVFSSGNVHLPFIAPPGTREDVLASLRAAFAALATDPEFVADAKRRNFAQVITDGATVEQMIDSYLGADPAVVARARALVQ